MLLQDALKMGTAELAAVGVETPGLDTRILLEAALKRSREELLLHEKPLTAREIAIFKGYLLRRGKREPVAKILGKREFWSLDFKITHATLDPRPASESLVEAVLAQRKNKLAPYRILDVGTGSGCLIITLLKEFPNATGIGVDISREAIEVAHENAATHGVNERVSFTVSNWTYSLNNPFDIIISNPPYIAAAEIPALAPEVREYDPMQALLGGADGLDAYRILAAEIPRLLKKDGISAVEIGYTQSEAVSALFKDAGMDVMEVKNDLEGQPRIVVATKN